MLFNKYQLNQSQECEASIFDSEVSDFSFKGRVKSITHYENDFRAFPVNFTILSNYSNNGEEKQQSFDINVKLAQTLVGLSSTLPANNEFKGIKKITESGNLSIYVAREVNNDGINVVFDFVLSNDTNKYVVEISSEFIPELLER